MVVRRSTLLLAPIAAVALLLAGCVPAPPSTPSPSASESGTPTPEPTETRVPDAVLPDLGGSEVLEFDSVVTFDSGDRFHITMTVYVPLETGTTEAQQIADYLTAQGDSSGIVDDTVAAGGVIQLIDLTVEGLDGPWPAGAVIPVRAGIGGQYTIAGTPSAPDPGTTFLNITGTGTGVIVAGLSASSPVTVFDWADLPLSYGMEAAQGYAFDTCDITTTQRAADYPSIANWVQSGCTFGADA